MKKISPSKKSIVGVLLVLILAMLYFFQNATFFLRTTTTLALIAIFILIDIIFKIRFKPRHYLFAILIIISGVLLSPLYAIYPDYDKVLHFIQPILICSIIFYLVDHLKLKLKWKLTFTFFIVVALLGMFEIGEYALDSFFDLKLQGVYLRDAAGLEKFNILQDPIDDTMTDLLLGVIGSSIYVLYSAFLNRKNLEKSQ